MLHLIKKAALNLIDSIVMGIFPIPWQVSKVNEEVLFSEVLREDTDQRWIPS